VGIFPFPWCLKLHDSDLTETIIAAEGVNLSHRRGVEAAGQGHLRFHYALSESLFWPPGCDLDRRASAGLEACDRFPINLVVAVPRRNLIRAAHHAYTLPLDFMPHASWRDEIRGSP